jgi:hypothetical protein
LSKWAANPGNGWCETVLHHFFSSPVCADDASAESGVVEGSDGNLYGTTMPPLATNPEDFQIAMAKPVQSNVGTENWIACDRIEVRN